MGAAKASTVDVREALEFLRKQLIACQEHLRFFDEMVAAAENEAQSEIMDVASGYFHLSILAHRDSVRLCLARLFDRSKAAESHGSLTIFRLMQLASEQPGAFPFRSTVQIKRMVTGDTRRLDAMSGSIGKLTSLRNSMIAHNDPDFILNSGAIRRSAVNVSGYRQLLELLKRIVGRYLRAMDDRRPTRHRWAIANADHFSQVTEWIKIGLDAYYGPEDPQQ